mmetsp:Transcript_106986/g.319968  ORF Transcript_106986/g.319968 Transcript_106986/m.319968 type:complete len:94 (-) Transcript_106986:995-1276(-)
MPVLGCLLPLRRDLGLERGVLYKDEGSHIWPGPSAVHSTWFCRSCHGTVSDLRRSSIAKSDLDDIEEGVLCFHPSDLVVVPPYDLGILVHENN